MKELYDFMYKRKSVRRYTDKKIDSKTLKKIEDNFENLTKFNNDIKTEIALVKREEVNIFCSVDAPYYLAIFSEKKENYLINAGFIFEQMDLYLSSIGIGACWIGLGLPTVALSKKSKLSFVILIGFGYPEFTLHRKNEIDFLRKDTDEISNIDNELSRTIRLAPSAMNGQPWYYEQLYNEINVYMPTGLSAKNLMLKKMRKIDVGISLCFAYIYLIANKNKVEFKIDTTEKRPNFKYVISMHYKK